MTKRSFLRGNLFFILLLTTLFIGRSGFAGGPVPIPCTTDAECQAEFDPPNNSACNDLFCIAAHPEVTNAAIVVDPNLSGCGYVVLGLVPESDLSEICYYDEPAQLASIDTCGNGVCSEAVGENCTTCPTDCLVPGEVCADTTGNPCPPTAVFSCEDGDLCTVNTCNGNTCNPPVAATCEEFTDFCCANGCTGPALGQTCAEAVAAGSIPDGSCDPDCWPPQSCGDQEIQAPETCDGSIPTSSSAGIGVTKTECRLPGTVNECTYCGDGIVDSPTEECDGTNATACGGSGCDASCLCVNNNPCNVLEGSGVFGSASNDPTDCSGWSCSLGDGASGGFGNLVLFLSLGSIWLCCMVGLKRRR